jgi:hypothetical protein
MNLYFLLFSPLPLRVPLLIATLLLRSEVGVLLGLPRKKAIEDLPILFFSGCVLQLILWKLFYNPYFFPLGPAACSSVLGFALNFFVYALASLLLARALHGRSLWRRFALLELLTVLFVNLIALLTAKGVII